MKHPLRLLVLGAALLATHAMAGARDELKSFTTGLKGLDGQFTQQVRDASGKLKESSSGRVVMSAPRLFRWEYTKPYPQLIAADGSKVWIYDPDLEQVTFRNPEELAAVSRRLLEDHDQYRAILEGFRRRVLEEFSYESVIPGIVRQIKETLQRQARV